MKIVNLTPHAIVLQGADGIRTTVPTSGTIARVSSLPGKPEAIDGIPVPVYSAQTWGGVENLPQPEEGTIYIVSIIVLGLAHVQSRGDCVAPGTGPNDGVVRNDKGQIEAVTRLVRG